MDFSKIERRLTLRPSSPMFARAAEGYILAGRLKEAEELCRAGLAKYPHYSTARVVLARCLAETGRTEESAELLKHVLRLYPDSGVVRGMLEAINAKSAASKAEAAPVVEGEKRGVVETNAKEEVLVSSAEADEPVFDVEEIPPVVELHKADALASPSVPAIHDAAEHATLREAIEPTPAQTAPLTSEQNVIDDGRIVSRTLAEIYAGQGAFEEAIHTYILLKRKRPGESKLIDGRIAELRGQQSKS